MICASSMARSVNIRLACREMSTPISRIASTASGVAGPAPRPPTPADSATQPFPASFWFSHPSAIGLRHVFPVHTTSTFFNWLLAASILNPEFSCTPSPD
jgi:hypothetical protein